MVSVASNRKHSPMRYTDHFANFALALALIDASSEAEMLPARSDRVAPDIANLAWFGSLIGNDRPGPANSALDIKRRFSAVSFVICALAQTYWATSSNCPK